MFIKTRHAAINVTVGDEPLSLSFEPIPAEGEEGWFWGEVDDDAGQVLLSVDPGAFQEISVPTRPAVEQEPEGQTAEPPNAPQLSEQGEEPDGQGEVQPSASAEQSDGKKNSAEPDGGAPTVDPAGETTTQPDGAVVQEQGPESGQTSAQAAGETTNEPQQPVVHPVFEDDPPVEEQGEEGQAPKPEASGDDGTQETAPSGATGTQKQSSQKNPSRGGQRGAR